MHGPEGGRGRPRGGQFSVDPSRRVSTADDFGFGMTESGIDVLAGGVGGSVLEVIPFAPAGAFASFILFPWLAHGLLPVAPEGAFRIHSIIWNRCAMLFITGSPPSRG